MRANITFPYLGICLGLQIAIIEFARHKLGLSDASSTEFNLETHAPVIALVSEWVDRDGQIEQRSQTSDLGGTMRLGAQACQLRADSRARQIYGKTRLWNVIVIVMKSTIIMCRVWKRQV